MRAFQAVRDGIDALGVSGPKSRQRARGSLSLELVIVLPILLMVLLAVVQLGTYLLATQAIQGAAMAGAREATLPGVTPARVRTAVMGALSGWSFVTALHEDDVRVADLPDGRVTVSVSIDADKAALNSMLYFPGFKLAGKKIRAQYVMRKE
jgi:Flp pilus assembly protein TadG